jgi:uncharacterized protein YbjT (DUF2867 family)
MKLLITGGTGHLGSAIVTRLAQDGHVVRVLARRRPRAPGVEWARGDLSTGEGLADAVEGVHTLIHAATHSPAAQRGSLQLRDLIRSPTDVDIDGTQALLAAAESAHIAHFIYISIVGLPQSTRLPYSRVKLAAEKVVRQSRVPWSILRATPFYWLLEKMTQRMVRHSIVLVPGTVRVQPVNSDDFADYVVRAVIDGQRGERQDFAGPDMLTLREVVDQYLAARRLRRRVWNVPLPARLKSAIEASQTSRAAVRGRTTWSQWLQGIP